MHQRGYTEHMEYQETAGRLWICWTPLGELTALPQIT